VKPVQVEICLFLYIQPPGTHTTSFQPIQLYIIFPLSGEGGGCFGGEAATFEGGEQLFDFDSGGVHNTILYSGQLKAREKGGF